MAKKLDDVVYDAQYEIFNNLKYSDILKLRVNKKMYQIVESYLNEDLNGKKLKVAVLLFSTFLTRLRVSVSNADADQDALYSINDVMKNFKHNINVDILRDILFHLKSNLNLTAPANLTLTGVINNMHVRIIPSDFLLANVEVLLSNEHRSVEIFMQYYSDTDTFIDVTYFSNSEGGILRERGPAMVRFQDEVKVFQKHYRNNRPHGTNGLPAMIFYTSKGVKNLEKWYSNGVMNKTDGPSVKMYNSTGTKLILEEWYENDQVHRAGGPAITMHNEEGDKIQEEWYTNGQIHRKYGPAVTNFKTDDPAIKKLAYWYNNGKLIRQCSIYK